ncbi:amino acid permease-associated region [Caldivirga maquilingensis IC-167]|uniref:Amino acid permease-associated region n=1 Tax=Caldivirga maquilingensis (strain ATCC 700844 / DSM 13496 / JCM 10307 / IC-167) TaxID=397948 RepID=A8ME79_CALMQ|nr:amino acid permease-associated region [Caldivirga maquilingensis IC-167]
MVGSGWLFAALAGAAYAGPASLISWIIAAVLFIFIGLAYAELGSMLPFSGSLVRIDHYAHGSVSNYLLGWAYLIGAATTVAMEAEAIIMYTNKYLPVFSSASGYLTPLGIAAAAALIAVFTLIQIIGVNVFSRVNTVITIWKFIVPSLTVILLLTLYFHPSNFTAYGGFIPLGWSAVFSAMIPSGIVWAYEGFRQALEYAGEARNPHVDVPLALIISILVTAGLYVALEVAFIGGIDWGKILLQDNSGRYTILIKPGDWQNLTQSNWAGSPFYTELTTSGIALLITFAVILLIDAWVSPAGTMGVYIGTTARSFYGFSRQGYFPELFGSLHKRFQTPWFSMIFTLVLALLFLLPFPTWYQIVSISSTATVVNYLAGGSSLVILRRTAPELRRSYRVRSPWLIGLLSFTASSMLIYLTGWPSLGYVFIVTAFGLPLMILGYRDRLSLSTRESVLFSLIYWVALASAMYLGLIENQLSFIVYWSIFTVVMVASLLYLRYKAKGSYAALEVSSASWFVGYMVVMGALSYLGSLGMGYLKYPWDYVLALAASIIFFIISVRQGFETRELTEIKTKGIPIE